MASERSHSKMAIAIKATLKTEITMERENMKPNTVSTMGNLNRENTKDEALIAGKMDPIMMENTAEVLAMDTASWFGDNSFIKVGGKMESLKANKNLKRSKPVKTASKKPKEKAARRSPQRQKKIRIERLIKKDLFIVPHINYLYFDQ